jgi:Histidine kinase-, DNA gyrase B-, and HSP90-like ATPase
MSDIYEKKSRWKWYLAGAGLLIILISMVYTQYLVAKLRIEERNRMDLYRRSTEIITTMDNDLPENIKLFISDINKSNNNIPVILTDEQFVLQDAHNFSKALDSFGLQTAKDTLFAQNELKSMRNNGYEPVKIEIEGKIAQYIFYKDSTILTLLKFYPIFQLILIGSFILFGYAAFSTARRSEQNQVWVGMAKETAHQLGTPITAILAWLDLLKTTHEGDENTQEIVGELEKDVNRLELVADRFSKIGSAPDLVQTDIREALERIRAYMQKRSPRKVSFDFPKMDINNPLNVKINNHLFDWVVENLLRNALDAMETGAGKITATISETGHFITIDISDTGKGIPANKFKTIFQPGYTTKKRGWGLGLSLAKRIIEDYHAGQIFVKKSAIGVGTTFTIQLPKIANT